MPVCWLSQSQRSRGLTARKTTSLWGPSLMARLASLPARWQPRAPEEVLRSVLLALLLQPQSLFPSESFPVKQVNLPLPMGHSQMVQLKSFPCRVPLAFPSQRCLLRGPSQLVPVSPPPPPTNLLESSSPESARNCRRANPLLHWWFRHPCNSQLPHAATVQGVFLLQLPLPIRPSPDRANRAPSPIRDSSADNRVRRPSHLWRFPAGYRMLPVASRCQFALALDALPPRPQNFPAQGVQLPAHGKAWATGSSPPSAHSHRLERADPRPSVPLALESLLHRHSLGPLPRVAMRTSPSKSADPAEQMAFSAPHPLQLAALLAHRADRTRPPAESPEYERGRDPSSRTGKLRIHSAQA